ncbi:acyl-CoA/acyl-ACP dehydrogenase [Flavobacteriaceae bacterium]|jgi:alkylation response protein AidB-like acyl-CoA dehydrogenase|nr:acyl-CoA/acyl-ACP dehydrogenase [Flavobacteriaceae bacterium]
MALVLNEEQQLLKESVKDFLETNAPVGALRKLRDENDSDYNENLWDEMVKMGLTSLTIKEKFGGLDFGYVALGQVLELTGRNLSVSPLISTALMSTTFINLLANEEQKNNYLPKIAIGSIKLCFAYQETSHFEIKNINTSLKSDGGKYILNGNKHFVIDAGISDYIIVLAKYESQDSYAGVIIDSNQKGVNINNSKFLDDRKVGNIKLENIEVNKNSIIKIEDFKLLEKVFDISCIGVSCEMLGISLEAFEKTLAYIKDRQQFGVRIGSFQALQHRAAKMFIELELCKSVIIKGLKSIDSDSNNLNELASLAKAKLGKTIKLITNEAIQMHGGIGMTDDIDIGFYIKRARVLQQTLGDYNYHLTRYAEISGY